MGGRMVDAQTHGLISGAKIRLQDAQNSYSFVEVFTNGKGEFQYTVLSKPLVISASAPGYRNLEFEGGSEQSLSSGEHRSIEIDLERD